MVGLGTNDEKNQWTENVHSFGVAMKSVCIGAISFLVMCEWRKNSKNRRLYYDQLNKSDKFKFIRDVMEKTAELGIKTNRKKEIDFEIIDVLKDLGYDIKDYI